MREQSNVWAVVPVKRFALAKQRLAAVLDASKRAELARVMLADVLEALARSKTHIGGVVVVTSDAEAAALAEKYDASVVSDEGREGLNAAIRLGLDCVADNGGEGVLIVPSDVPHLLPQMVARAVDAIQAPNTLAAVPAADDRGTNLLGCRPAGALPLCFGPGSFDSHCEAARAQGMAVRVLPIDSLGLDLDRPKNLDDFLALKSATRTHGLLASQRACAESAALKKGPHEGGLTCEEAYGLVDLRDIAPLMQQGAARRDHAHGRIISYSRKVFIPLTQLCRDVCHYCTFAHPPRPGERAFLTREEVLAIARAGRAAGCKEALFTLGDKPELRYRAVRDELGQLGHATTLSYLAEMAALVFKETGLLPHLNPGVLAKDDLAALRKVSVSQGIMLESASGRLMDKGGPHHGSPDKEPALRLATIRTAGEQSIPFTTGILIGIGETRRERIDALLALRNLHERYGHIQEIIIQNFRPKPGTRMADVPAPSLEEHLWTIAMARLIFPPSMNIQAPPNLSPGALRRLIEAGINDWGGVSPVTPDHVNPEAPWPHLQVLERATVAAGKQLHERLAIYPAFAADHRKWTDPALHAAVLQRIDGEGRPREDDWSPGAMTPLPRDAQRAVAPAIATGELSNIIERAAAGHALAENDVVRLFQARGDDFAVVCAAADALRRETCGDTVSYV
ncbi:MAG TPA: 7,8-didemethyl-8-hydroxy-5-deazariboflavin synthase CofG, partial [Pseudolabrys sp.]|nr:7,8-didemethyl-8-hydroxy-5-deazariboflavin synthase CofG [Pseudolabrys sp.]